jgi:hypothetical protein
LDHGIQASLVVNHKTQNVLIKIANVVRCYFKAAHWNDFLYEILPNFNPNLPKRAIGTLRIIAIIALIFPCMPDVYCEELDTKLWLPTAFHLWNLLPNQIKMDKTMINLCARIAADYASAIPLGDFGVFSEKQFIHIMTASFRLLRLPVGCSKSTEKSLTDSLVTTQETGGSYIRCIAAIFVWSLGPLKNGNQAAAHYCTAQQFYSNF